jgi:hypothetical protein
MAEPTPVTIPRRVTAIDALLTAAGTALQPGAAPTAHAESHAAEGADEITPAAIGAAAADHDHDGDYAPADHNHSGTYIEALPAQVSSEEITAGTETALRSYSVADVVSLIDEHAPEVTANAVTSTDVTSIVKLTQAAYDALDPVVSTTLYVIVEA